MPKHIEIITYRYMAALYYYTVIATTLLYTTLYTVTAFSA